MEGACWTSLIIAALYQPVLTSGLELPLARNVRGAARSPRHPSTNSTPAGATDAGTELKGWGRAFAPVPLVRTAGGGGGCPRGGPLSAFGLPRRNAAEGVAAPGLTP